MQHSGDQERTHAEIQVLKDIDELYNSFVGFSIPLDYIILYTWIHPCKKCPDRIKHKFPNGKFKDRQVYIGYTTQGNKIDPPLTEKDRNSIANSFRLAGLPFYRIKKPQKKIKKNQRADRRTDL
eukprot:m.41968 g.41968  ORF g.41968 m.41968 type:complete len:124 (+) comp33315_c0_seq2:249-620(+)